MNIAKKIHCVVDTSICYGKEPLYGEVCDSRVTKSSYKI